MHVFVGLGYRGTNKLIYKVGLGYRGTNKLIYKRSLFVYKKIEQQINFFTHRAVAVQHGQNICYFHEPSPSGHQCPIEVSGGRGGS